MVSRDRPLSFLLDVDNTLLDNDALKELLAAQLRQALGAPGAARFWVLYEDVRHERDVVDLPLTAQRYAAETGRADQAEDIDQILDRLPFARFLYPHALDTLRHLATLGTVSILSDGDHVFQRRKIERSGLAAAVGRVRIYTHKEDHLDEVVPRQPGQQTVLIEDKARILDDVKRILGPRVTTVQVLQGHYAHEPVPAGFHADLTVQAIGDLRTVPAERFYLL
ncbi:MAG TPA: HAD family hydrolase [Chloroflexota bacterium]|nr:HAD family hydrolase [Chloroflexota bacterium]